MVQNGFFASQGRHIAAGAKRHFFGAKNVGLQPSKLSKFGILPINLPPSDEFARIVRNSQHLYVSIVFMFFFSLVTFGEQTTKL